MEITRVSADVGGLVGRQEGHEFCHLRRAAGALHGHHLLDGGGIEGAFDHVGLDDARRHPSPLPCGNFFVVVAGTGIGEHGVHLSLEALSTHADLMNPAWLKAAFVLCLVGYGTKKSVLCPFITGLPATYSEAPSLVAALLSGALKACAFRVFFAYIR